MRLNCQLRKTAESSISLLLALIAIPIAFIAGIVFAVVLPVLSQGGSESLSWLIMGAVYMLIGLVISRLMLVLPSRAVDEEISFGDSWSATSLVKWKVFILLSLLPIISSFTTEFIASFDVLFLSVLSILLQAVFALFELALLSICYQKLVVEVRNREQEALHL